MKKLLKNWYWVIIGGFVLMAALVYLILGENSVIAPHDNLDLFVPQYKMMKDTGTFFAHNARVPFLANISRDYLPSELNLYTVVFMIFPEFAAYIICYFLKIFIGLAGSILLAKAVLKNDFKKYESIAYLIAFAFAILNLFPNFGIAFAAIPLLVFIMHKIVEKPRFVWFAALFCYPFISYFSYLGIFFVGYMCLYFIYRWIKTRKFPWHILVAIVVLSVGYAVFEYRLFSEMLFSDVISIRTTMVQASLSGKDILSMIWEGFFTGDMHTESVHRFFVMPITLIFFLALNIGYIVKKKYKCIFTDYFNLTMYFIVFNSLIYGLYYWEPLRNLFEMLLPPLKGFEFHRTEFVNPFLWYVAFFIVLKRIYDYLPKLKWAANVLAVIAVLIVVLCPTRYNDLYNTLRFQATKLISGHANNDLTYREFYSVDLFEKAKKDVDYDGEWSVAYGFYPAVLEYNGIHTLDGYLGYYPQYYKEDFRKIIAPALDRIPESKSYFDIWGARCCMYSGTYVSNTNAYRNYEYTDEDLYMDVNAFKDYAGRYIFSRVKLNNADEVGFDLVNVYTDENSPYTLYLYRTKSMFPESAHYDIPYEQRDTDYDISALDKLLTDMQTEAESASTVSKEQIDKMSLMYDESTELMDELISSYAVCQIEFDKDITNDEKLSAMNEVYEYNVDYSDRFFQTLRSIAFSPYDVVIGDKLGSYYIDILKEYEDMTPEQKDRSVKIKSLQTEYEQAVSEDYFFNYNGTMWDYDSYYEQRDTLDADEAYDIYLGLTNEKAKAVGEIYSELVNLYTEAAREEGYDNYNDYAYYVQYLRDYSLEDVKNMCSVVRKSCKKYFRKAENCYYRMDSYNPGFLTEDDTATFEAMKPYFYRLNPELGVPLEHMLNLGLYDLSPKDGKADTGYTLEMPSYNDAYIFDSPYMSSEDVYTYVHEFGHFTNFYYLDESLVAQFQNLDSSEVHSQGMEVLFNKYYGELYGDTTGDYLTIGSLNKMIYNVYSACLNTEFEIYSFEHPKATVEELGKEYFRLYDAYGLAGGMGDIEVLNTWIEVPHFFVSPGYYVSYATSGLAALELYDLSLENEESAVNKYMQLLSMSSAWGFKESLDYVGMNDIFDEENIKEIFVKTTKNMEIISDMY